MPRRMCILLLTFLVVAATALPAGAQLLPQVTPKPATPPATKPAQIMVETSPNAEVYLDDQYTGRASPEGRLVIGNPKPGEHNLRVSLAGKRDFQRKVTVVAGQVNKMTVVLADLAGTVVVRTSPGAVVFLDDSSRGTTDAAGQLSVPDVVAGSHELRIAVPGKREYRQNVTVPAGKEARVDAPLADLARTREELIALAHRADRDYFEFNLSHLKAQQKVGTVTIELDKTDTKQNVFSVNLVFDGKPHVHRDKAMNKPVYFYVQGSSSAEELVVNKLGKDSIAGYISTPKGLFPSTPNVPAVRLGQGEAEKVLLPGAVRENPKDGLNYVWIPPGSFRMGCPPGDNECGSDEKPSHQVTISKGFWIGQTEVTVGAYKRFAAATGRQMPPVPNFNSSWANDGMPIVNVTWNDAHDFCAWAGGWLPTEAEWEYAARGGSTEARYGPIDEVAWYSANSGGRAHPAGEKRANGFGLYDVLGNVWEWVNDWYDQNYYQNSPSQDPSGPASGQQRVLRGASWNNNPRVVRVSNRFRYNPAGSYLLGVRCGREVAGP